MNEHKKHKLKVYYNLKGEAYIIFKGLRYYLKYFLSNDKYAYYCITNCYYLIIENIKYGINDYIILTERIY